MMARTVTGLCCALIALFCATVINQPAIAKGSRSDSPYECKISYRGTTVTQRYRSDGILLSELEPAGDADPLRRQLAVVLAEKAKDLESNCARIDTIATDGQPVFGYGCSFERIDDGVRTFIHDSGWTWSKDLGDGYRISLNPGGILARGPNGKLLPDFSERSPLMWIEGPKGGTDRNFGRNGVWQYRVAVEVRVGHRVYRHWAASNVLGVIEWTLWPQLFSDPGDIELTVYDTELGVLNRSTLARNIFDQIEARVSADIAQFRLIQDDPVGKCKLQMDWEGGPGIVVT